MGGGNKNGSSSRGGGVLGGRGGLVTVKWNDYQRGPDECISLPRSINLSKDGLQFMSIIFMM